MLTNKQILLRLVFCFASSMPAFLILLMPYKYLIEWNYFILSEWFLLIPSALIFILKMSKKIWLHRCATALSITQLSYFKLFTFEINNGNLDTIQGFFFNIRRLWTDEELYDYLINTLNYNTNFVNSINLISSSNSSKQLLKHLVNCESFDKPSNINMLDSISSNWQNITILIGIIGIAAIVTTGCLGIYSWVFPSKFDAAFSKDILKDIAEVTHQNRNAINNLASIVIPTTKDVSNLITRVNTSSRVLQSHDNALRTSSNTLTEIADYTNTITTTSKSLSDLANLVSENSQQIAGLQMQTANTVIMLHKHELWLREIHAHLSA